jgi:hypothetical protein
MRSRMFLPSVSPPSKPLPGAATAADKSVRPTPATYPGNVGALLIKCRGLHAGLRVHASFHA